VLVLVARDGLDQLAPAPVDEPGAQPTCEEVALEVLEGERVVEDPDVALPRLRRREPPSHAASKRRPHADRPRPEEEVAPVPGPSEDEHRPAAEKSLLRHVPPSLSCVRRWR
jgi:hypothetical protein